MIKTAAIMLPAVALIAVTLMSGGAHAGEMEGDAAFASGHYQTALREWRELAAKGEASAMLGIGTLYDTGHGVRQDFSTALAWYRRAADAGSVSAAFNVGVMYDNGRGTAVNHGEAIKWFRFAAEKGFGRAAYNLGVIYRDGDGVPQDPDAAIRYFRLANRNGIVAARGNLAALGSPLPPAPPAAPKPRPSRAGSGSPALAEVQQAALDRSDVTPSAADVFAKSVPAFLERAAGGDNVAQYDVGWAYQHGVGVGTDPARAYVYYLRAATSGAARVRTAALKGASEVSDQMTGQQHEAARTMLLDAQP